jgi:hypothetical protein
MKNLKIVLVMFIVSIAGLAKTFAQTGTGFLRPGFEYQTNVQSIEDNFRTAFQKAFGRGDYTCFERDVAAGETPSVPATVVIRTISDHLRSSGVQSLTGIDVMEMFRNGQVTYDVVGPSYWDTHENAYFTRNGGLDWWDPRTSSKFHRTEWVIAHFHLNNTVVDIVANCGNIVRSKYQNTNDGTEAFPANNQQQAAYVAPGINQTQIGLANVTGSNNNVVVNNGNNLIPTKKSWFAKHWWIVPVAAVVVGGAIYLAGHHGSSTPTPTYSNEIHGGTDGSGAGDGGGVPHTY